MGTLSISISGSTIGGFVLLFALALERENPLLLTIGVDFKYFSSNDDGLMVVVA